MGSSLLKHLTFASFYFLTFFGLSAVMADLPPLTGADGWGEGRFSGLGGKRMFFLEIGGGCHCSCIRPGDANWAETEYAAVGAFVARMAAVAGAGRQHCEKNIKLK